MNIIGGAPCKCSLAEQFLSIFIFKHCGQTHFLLGNVCKANFPHKDKNIDSVTIYKLGPTFNLSYKKKASDTYSHTEWHWMVPMQVNKWLPDIYYSTLQLDTLLVGNVCKANFPHKDKNLDFLTIYKLGPTFNLSYKRRQVIHTAILNGTGWCPCWGINGSPTLIIQHCSQTHFLVGNVCKANFPDKEKIDFVTIYKLGPTFNLSYKRRQVIHIAILNGIWWRLYLHNKRRYVSLFICLFDCCRSLAERLDRSRPNLALDDPRSVLVKV